MSPTKILTNPDPILRKKSVEIPIKNIGSSNIQKIVAEMKTALQNAKDGVGLAAPQIGHSVRIFLVSEEAEEIDKNENKQSNEEKKNWTYHVFINPVIKKFSAKKIDMAEGCLSVPEIYGVVRRPEKINLDWHDECGKKHTRGFSKFFARVIQHETDHLDGILFIDKMRAEVKLGNEKSML